MLQVLHYEARRSGDIFLVDSPNWLSRAIQDAEIEINPLSDTHVWVPSHAGIFGPEPGQVTEAWLDGNQNSAVALNPESKYDGYFGHGQMQIWRCEAPAEVCHDALVSLRGALAKDGYGLADLIGFEIEALAARLGCRIDNPIEFGFVCSQVALAHLLAVNIYSGAESWAKEVAIRNCTPDLLGIEFCKHKSGVVV